MTTGKLYGILTFLEAIETDLRLQSTLETIGNNLNNLTNSPAQPQYQSSLGTALKALDNAAPKLRELITPSLAAEIKAMGGDEFFDPVIADKVKESVQTNGMTPAVARDYVKDLISERATFLEGVRSAIQSLKQLNLNESPLQPGSADLAFLIPRDIFKNQIGPLAKELHFINRLVEHVSEAITGKAEPAVLEQLSSSDPTVAILAGTTIILAIGDIVNRFLEAWKKIEEIRQMRAKLGDMGLKGKALEELTDEVTTTIDEVVEQSTRLVLAQYPGDGGRKAELTNAIRTDARRLFGQIERGLKVEIRVNPEDGEATEEADKKALEQLDVLARSFVFPQPAKHPMLLEGGEVLEGEFATKTTTHKKIVSKKVRAKGGDGVGEQAED